MNKKKPQITNNIEKKRLALTKNQRNENNNERPVFKPN